MAWVNLREELAQEFEGLLPSEDQIKDALMRRDERARARKNEYNELYRWAHGAALPRPRAELAPVETAEERNARHQREHMERQYAAGLPRGGKSGPGAKLVLTPEVLELVRKSTSAVELAKALGRSRALAYRLRAQVLSVPTMETK